MYSGNGFIQAKQGEISLTSNTNKTLQLTDTALTASTGAKTSLSMSDEGIELKSSGAKLSLTKNSVELSYPSTNANGYSSSAGFVANSNMVTIGYPGNTLSLISGSLYVNNEGPGISETFTVDAYTEKDGILSWVATKKMTFKHGILVKIE